MAIIYRDDEHTREEHCLRGKLQVIQRVLAKGEEWARTLHMRDGSWVHPATVNKLAEQRGVKGVGKQSLNRWFADAEEAWSAEVAEAQRKRTAEKQADARKQAAKYLAGAALLREGAEGDAAILDG